MQVHRVHIRLSTERSENRCFFLSPTHSLEYYISSVHKTGYKQTVNTIYNLETLPDLGLRCLHKILPVLFTTEIRKVNMTLLSLEIDLSN